MAFGAELKSSHHKCGVVTSLCCPMMFVDPALNEKLVALAGAHGNQRTGCLSGDEPQTLELDFELSLLVFRVQVPMPVLITAHSLSRND